MPFNLVIVIAPKSAFLDKDGNICLLKSDSAPVRPTSPGGDAIRASISSPDVEITGTRERSESKIGAAAVPGLPMLEYLNTALTYDSSVQIVEEVIVKQHLEEVLQSLFEDEFICTKATIFDDVSANSIQAMFICNEGANADMVITRLAHVGIGSLVGSVNVVGLESSKFYKRPVPVPEDKAESLNPNTKSEAPEVDDEEEERQEQERKLFLAAASRIRVEQIVETIEAGAVMRFDYLSLLTVAGTIAGIGLATNNTVAIVASMLVSPIMGPVLALTFGTVIDDRALMTLGLRTELLSLLVCIFIGFVLGACSILIGTDGLWPTPEMYGRGLTDALAIGLGIAIPSGVGVALSVLGNNTSSLVGVAISASLLPPAVNCGICFAYAAFGFHVDSGAVDDQDEFSTPASYIRLGGVSLALTLVNIGAIYIAGLAMFKIKEVAPLDQKAAFWQTDIKTTRDDNKRMSTRPHNGQFAGDAGTPGMDGLNVNPYSDINHQLEMFDLRNNRHALPILPILPITPGIGGAGIPMASYGSPRNRHSTSFAHETLRQFGLDNGMSSGTPANRSSGDFTRSPARSPVRGGAAGNRYSLPPQSAGKLDPVRIDQPTQADLQGIKQRFRKKATAKNFGKKVESC